MANFSIKKTPTIISASAGWLNPARVKVKNGQFARNTNGNIIVVTGFGYTVPDGALITGIKIETTRKGSVLGMQDSVGLVIPGLTTTGVTANIPLRNKTRINGKIDRIPGVTDIVMPAQVNSSDFGVIYSKAFTGTVFLDSIEVTVFYTTA